MGEKHCRDDDRCIASRHRSGTASTSDTYVSQSPSDHLKDEVASESHEAGPPVAVVEGEETLVDHDEADMIELANVVVSEEDLRHALAEQILQAPWEYHQLARAVHCLLSIRW